MLTYISTIVYFEEAVFLPKGLGWLVQLNSPCMHVCRQSTISSSTKSKVTRKECFTKGIDYLYMSHAGLLADADGGPCD
jgi:hypothetical protein